MIRRIIFLLPLLVFSWFVVDSWRNQEMLQPVTKEFSLWADDIVSDFNRDNIADDLSVFLKLVNGENVREWKFASLPSGVRPITREDFDSQRLMIRLLQMINESGLVGSSVVESNDNIMNYLEINAGSSEKTFYTRVPLTELRKNIQAMNMIILLQNKKA